MELVKVRWLTLGLLGLIVASAAVIIANRGPVWVKHCEVTATESGGVLFQAEVLTRTKSAVSDVSIIVGTGDGRTLYVLPGPYATGVWQQHQVRESAQRARLDPLPFGSHFRPIAECFPQAITFVDGSVDVLYNPL